MLLLRVPTKCADCVCACYGGSLRYTGTGTGADRDGYDEAGHEAFVSGRPGLMSFPALPPIELEDPDTQASNSICKFYSCTAGCHKCFTYFRTCIPSDTM